MNPEAVTFWIAVWGAVLGTASFGWNIYRSAIDRGRLYVRCSIDHIVQVGAVAVGAARPRGPKLTYRVTNVGRRPIFLDRIGGGYSKQHFMIIQGEAPWPRELKPGESYVGWGNEDPVKTLLGDGGVKFLGAWDTTGRLYRVSRRDLQLLFAEAKRLRGDGAYQKARPAAGRGGR